MTDFAKLLMTVDATGMASGEQALDRLATKGAQVERQVANSNRAVTRSMDDVGKSASNLAPRIQNASYQVGDFFVQIAGGGSAVTAFAQQLPQLLGGLGMFGALAGAGVAIGGALIPMLFDGADSAEDMADRLDDLNSHLSDYLDIAAMANASTAEMYEKFGDAADAARETYEALLEIERIEFLQEMGATAEALSEDLDALRGALTRYQGAVASSDGLGEDKVLAMQIAVNDLNAEFGLTVDQAESVGSALEALGAARDKGPRAAADAARALGDGLMEAYEAGGRTNEELLSAAKRAYEFQVTAEAAAHVMGDVGDATISAADASESWADAMARVNAQLAGAMSLLSSIGGGMVQRAGISAANAVLDAGGTSIAAEKARRRAEERTRLTNEANTAAGFMSPDMLDANLAEMERQWALQDEYEARLTGVREGERAAARASRKKGGKGKKPAKDRMDGFERSVADIQSETEAFLRQADALAQVTAAGGDWERALAVIEEEQKLLNAAQKAGIDLTPQVRQGITEMAEAYVDAEEQLERMREVTDKGQDAMEGLFGSITDGADGVIDSLKGILEQIAKVQLAKAGMGLLGATSWGAGLISGIGDLMSFDGGGDTPSGPRSGGLDGKGGFLALLHPNETVTDHTRGQSAGGAVDVRVFMDEDGAWQARVERISGAVSARTVAQHAEKQSQQQYLTGGR